MHNGTITFHVSWDKIFALCQYLYIVPCLLCTERRRAQRKAICVTHLQFALFLLNFFNLAVMFCAINFCMANFCGQSSEHQSFYHVTRCHTQKIELLCRFLLLACDPVPINTTWFWLVNCTDVMSSSCGYSGNKTNHRRRMCHKKFRCLKCLKLWNRTNSLLYCCARSSYFESHSCKNLSGQRPTVYNSIPKSQ